MTSQAVSIVYRPLSLKQNVMVVKLINMCDYLLRTCISSRKYVTLLIATLFLSVVKRFDVCVMSSDIWSLGVKNVLCFH